MTKELVKAIGKLLAGIVFIVMFVGSVIFMAHILELIVKILEKAAA